MSPQLLTRVRCDTKHQLNARWLVWVFSKELSLRACCYWKSSQNLLILIKWNYSSRTSVTTLAAPTVETLPHPTWEHLSFQAATVDPPRAPQSGLNMDAWPKAWPVSLLICENRLTSVSHLRLCGTCSSLTCTMSLLPTQTWANWGWQQCSYDSFCLHASSANQAESVVEEYFAKKGVTVVMFSRDTQLELRMIFLVFPNGSWTSGPLKCVQEITNMF